MNPPLLTVIPLTTAMLPATEQQLKHLGTLGPVLNHGVLFVSDPTLAEEQFKPLLTMAEPLFPAGGELIRVPKLDPAPPAYPHAHNLRFETAAKHIMAHQRAPWLFLPPTALPTRRGWLLELEQEYNAHSIGQSPKPFLGQLLTPEQNGTGTPLVPCCAIYPATLPPRMLQRLVARRHEDFELSCAELIVPLAYPSRLIWNDVMRNGDTPPQLPQIASIVVSRQPRQMLAKLRGEPAPAPAAPPPVKPQPKPLARAAYYHSGDFGDIIYALCAVKLADGGKFLIGPTQRRTPSAANPIREDRFDFFAPLLRVQPYLSKVEYSPRYPGTDEAFDMNIFRDRWGDKELRARTGITTLVGMHCHILGVREQFRHDDPWLTVPDPIQTGMYVIHRSPRYRNEAFPWELIVKQLKGKLLFVGLASEHAEFQRTFSTKVDFWQVSDALKLGRVIAGSLGFIGNQSFPNAIALGLGQRVVQESWDVSPDCLFPRPNFLTQPFNETKLAEWRKSPLLTWGEKPKEQDADTPTTAGLVIASKCADGLIHLGPQDKAFGLGDTLTITPLAAALGHKAVVCLPPVLERYSCLFDGLCDVRITDDYPVFPNPGKERFIESKLQLFGIGCEDGQTVPVVKVKGWEVSAAKREIGKSEKPLLFVQLECAKEWEHVRSRPEPFWKPILSELQEKFTIITASPQKSPRQVAALLRVTGRYFGVNTGIWHLAMSQNCRCLVVDADACDGYDPALWRYTLPNVEYVGFDQQNIFAKLAWLHQ